MRYYIPDYVRRAVGLLNSHGFSAYPVGGCVRDTLLSRPVHDWDITTAARPDDIVRVFGDAVCGDEGKKYGTVRVKVDGEMMEITAFRVEGGYSDMRRPDSVEFTSDLNDDLSRRDFTVNAMAFDEDGTLIDPFGGLSDINDRLLRAVGDADTRFGEDALRIMRALRFSSVLGFSLEKNTHEAVFLCRGLLRHVARERIYEEFKKLMSGRDAHRVICEYADVIAVFMPDITAAGEYSLAFACDTVSRLPADFHIRTAALYIAKGFPDADALADSFLCSLKSDRAARNKVSAIIKAASMLCDTSETGIKKAMALMGADAVKAALLIKQSMAKASRDEDGALLYEAASQKAEAVINSGECITVGGLAIDGRDLISLGFEPSPRMGETLSRLLFAVIEGETENSRGALLEYAKKLMGQT
ncbi:MAG: CCA tRNA nucleotidyltransferase [Clostridia bacterium]|nr:CCA tRNA nucleotidyltransferase [Clostridia bacterium]